jgi:protein-L-isoaspartate(D-aspartate) O-methyltransferase
MWNDAEMKYIPFHHHEGEENLTMMTWIMISALGLFLAQISTEPDPFREKREEMVKTQLIPRGIVSQKVLNALRKVPRHLYVPQEYQQLAYTDRPLPIGYDQTISQPYIVAFMTEVLDIQSGDKVLEIGTGSGYQAAVLCELGAEVFSVEIIRPLAERAEAILKQSGLTGFHLKTGDGYQGWKDFAPYHAIIVTCSPSRIPPPLIEQLEDGGKMIIPVGNEGYVQYLFLLEKHKEGTVEKKVMAVRFVPMVNDKKISY